MRPRYLPFSLFKLMNSLPLSHVFRMMDCLTIGSKAMMPTDQGLKLPKLLKIKPFSLSWSPLVPVPLSERWPLKHIPEFHVVNYKGIIAVRQLRKKLIYKCERLEGISLHFNVIWSDSKRLLWLQNWKHLILRRMSRAFIASFEQSEPSSGSVVISCFISLRN